MVVNLLRRRRKSATKSSAEFFDLRTISGLRLWLDAAQLASYADNESITTWGDLSGNNKNATLISGISAPIFKLNGINGRPSVYFAGNNLLKSLVNVQQPFTLFVLFQLEIFKNDSYLVEASFVNEATIQFSYNNPSNKLMPKIGIFLGSLDGTNYLYPYIGSPAQGHELVKGITGSYLYSCVANGVSSKSLLNATNLKQGNSGDQGFTTLTLGGDSNGSLDPTYRIQGSVARLALYSGALPDLDRERIEGAWMAEYGL